MQRVSAFSMIQRQVNCSLARFVRPGNWFETMHRRAFLKTCGLGTIALSSPVWAASEAESLFDGKSLKGWHKPPKRIGHGTGGHWFVKDGLLVCEQDPPGSGNGGLLLSDE